MRRAASLLLSILASSCVVFTSGCNSSYQPKGAKIPEGFQIACYPQSTCTRSDSTPLPGNQKQMIVVLITDDDLQKVCDWYKTELTFKGYRVLSDNTQKNGTMVLESEEEKLHCTVSLTPLKDTMKTVISISTFPKPI